MTSEQVPNPGAIHTKAGLISYRQVLEGLGKNSIPIIGRRPLDKLPNTTTIINGTDSISSAVGKFTERCRIFVYRNGNQRDDQV